MKHFKTYHAEGVFQIAYRDEPQSGDVQNRLILIVRDDQVFGSDQHGGVYAGLIAWTERRDRTYEFSAHVSCESPPAGELVAGLDARGAGASMTIVGAIDPAEKRQSATIELNGVVIAVDIDYVGPLPHFKQRSITDG